MNLTHKTLISRQLSKASTALHQAHVIAVDNGDLELAASLRRQQIEVADKITQLSGGPIRLKGSDLLK